MATLLGRIERLENDVDLRIADIWQDTLDVEEWTPEIVVAFLRAAYGKGYADALSERTRGGLMLDHGYPVPSPPLPWDRQS